MARTGANSATLLVGDTGSGKSSLLATYAEWVWERFHVQTRYYSSDGGGWGDKMEALIQLGIVLVWKIRTRDPDGALGLAQETIIRASQGWWPRFIDPESGECPLGSPMDPPAAGWKGAVMYDGLSSLCDWSLDELGVRNAAGLLGGEATAIKTLLSGDLKLSSSNRGGVGFVQGRVQNWINNTLAIRGLVAPPVFTALEQKTTDDDTRLLVYGPKIAGRARMTDVPSWVGNCLGTCLAVGADGKPQYRLYTMEYRYPATDSTRHLCGNRTNQMGLLPEFLADEPGKPFGRFNLGFFFELLQKALEQTLAEGRAKFKDAPGLPKSNYEEAPAAMPAAGPALASPFAPGPGGPLSPFSPPAGPAAPAAAPGPPAAPAPPAGPPGPPGLPGPTMPAGPAALPPPPAAPQAAPAPAPMAPPEAPARRGPGRPRKEPAAPSTPAPASVPPAGPPVAATPEAPQAHSPVAPSLPSPVAPAAPAVPPVVGRGAESAPSVPVLPPQPSLPTAPVAGVMAAPPIRPAPPGIRPPARSPIPAGPAGAKS